MKDPPAAVHVDLDGGPHIFRAHDWTYPSEEDPLYFSGLSAFLDLFKDQGIRATLFVIAEDVRDPEKLELLQEAVAQGHEIASHTVTHRRLTDLSPDDQRREIAGSRRLLGETFGCSVAGFRAPWFKIDRQTLEIVDAAGYTYDSSLFPSSVRGLGRAALSAADSRPYTPLSGQPLLELPMPGRGVLPIPFHPSYSLVLGNWHFRSGLSRYRRTGAPYVLLFHLTDLAEPLPREIVRSRAQRLYTLSHLNADTKRARCARMLELTAQHYRLRTTEWLLREDS